MNKPVLSLVEGHVLSRVERRILRTASGPVLLVFLLIVGAGCQAEAPVGDPQAVTSRLVTLLQDSSPDVRRTAALSLGKIGHSAATTALIERLSDPDSQVREYSAWALGQIGEDVNDEAAVRLAGALGDQHHAVKQAAARALGHIGPRQPVIAILTQALAVGESGSRRAAVEALAQLEARSAYPALRKALTDPDPAVRQGALAALGELGDRGVLPDFRERLLFDADPGVRTEAAYRLGKLGDPGDHGELQTLDEAARHDASPGVRVWADRARAYIGPAMAGEEN
ncbi:MAG: HEAT repeat domain-containing protein [Nitrospira sp.]|nr:HEAT repeat domain-containing protein [Nitrospira sp.]